MCAGLLLLCRYGVHARDPRSTVASSHPSIRHRCDSERDRYFRASMSRMWHGSLHVRLDAHSTLGAKLSAAAFTAVSHLRLSFALSLSLSLSLALSLSPFRPKPVNLERLIECLQDAYHAHHAVSSAPATSSLAAGSDGNMQSVDSPSSAAAQANGHGKKRRADAVETKEQPSSPGLPTPHGNHDSAQPPQSRRQRTSYDAAPTQ